MQVNEPPPAAGNSPYPPRGRLATALGSRGAEQTWWRGSHSAAGLFLQDAVRPRAPGVTQSSRGHSQMPMAATMAPASGSLCLLLWRSNPTGCQAGRLGSPPGCPAQSGHLWAPGPAHSLHSFPARIRGLRKTDGLSLLAWPTLARRHPPAPSGRSLTSAGCREYLRHVIAGKVSWGRHGGWRARRAEHRAQEDCGVLPGRGKPGAGRGRAEPGAGGAPRSCARRPGERSLRLFVPHSLPRDLGVTVPARLQGRPEVTATGTRAASAPDGSSPGLPARVCL